MKDIIDLSTYLKLISLIVCCIASRVLFVAFWRLHLHRRSKAKVVRGKAKNIGDCFQLYSAFQMNRQQPSPLQPDPLPPAKPRPPVPDRAGGAARTRRFTSRFADSIRALQKLVFRIRYSLVRPTTPIPFPTL